MDPFEEELRRAPWRRPSEDLRERLFAEREENTVVTGSFEKWPVWGWAAAVAVAVSVTLVGALFKSTGSDNSRMPSRIATESIEFASNEGFFDFSSTPTVDPWAGGLTLQIEPN